MSCSPYPTVATTSYGSYASPPSPTVATTYLPGSSETTSLLTGAPAETTQTEVSYPTIYTSSPSFSGGAGACTTSYQLTSPAPVTVTEVPAVVTIPQQPVVVSSCATPLPAVTPSPQIVVRGGQCCDMKDLYTSTHSELVSLKEKNLTLERRLMEAEARSFQVVKLEAELAQLRQQITNEKQRAVQLETSRQQLSIQNNGLQEQLRASEGRIAGLQNQFNSQRIAMQEQIAALEQRLRASESNHEQAAKHIGMLESQLKTWEARANEMQAKFAAERRSWEENMFAIQQQLQQCNAKREEAAKAAAHWEAMYKESQAKLQAAQQTIAELQRHIQKLEIEIRNLMARLEVRANVQSQTSVKETYKVKSFEIAAKLAISDGTDDGMYNGLPIEVEGQGLYRDLVAQGRRPNPAAGGSATFSTSPTKVTSVAASPAKVTSGTSGAKTYVVGDRDTAERVAKMNPANDGTYNGLPIEVKGMGLLRELRASKA